MDFNNFSLSFQPFINTYNSQDSSPADKRKSLEKINSIVEEALKNPLFSEEAEQVKNWLIKQVHVRPEDQSLWNHILRGIEKTSLSYISEFDLASHSSLPPEVSSQITKKIEDIELLESFSLSPEKRFQLALRVGEELTTLDLSHFSELDNEKLNTLHKACPHLRSLNLANTPIERLDLSILHSFSKLEVLDVSQTQIETLDGLPKNLKELHLRQSKNIKAEEFQKLNDFSQLETLDVVWTNIKTLDTLPKNLKMLFLGGASLTAEEFQKLNDFSQLEKLDVSQTQIEILDLLPENLKVLNLFLCVKLKAEEFQKLNALSQLEKLNVSQTQIETLDGLPKSLNELHLRYCENLKAEEFQKLNAFPQLEILDVSGNNIETPDIHPPKLRRIITNEGIRNIGQ